jgi:hypothetical protein
VTYNVEQREYVSRNNTAYQTIVKLQVKYELDQT